MGLANFFSFFRLPFLILHLLISPYLSPFSNSVLVILNYLFDAVDGIIARSFGSTSYGEFMDISVDRVVTLTYFAFHLSKAKITFWFFFLVLFRDIFADYVFYFNLIKSGSLERHKITSGIFYLIYSSKISKILNASLQILIACWGFFGAVPILIQLLFILNSYIRALPNFLDLFSTKF